MKHKHSPRTAQHGTFIFTVESLSHEGRGIAHYGSHPNHPEDKRGKKVFITGALTGETVRARIRKVITKLEEADCIEVLSDHSVLRTTPICAHYEQCGGCSLQHLQVDEQIALKQQVLQSHLLHFAGVEVPIWLSPLRATVTDYRKKARIGVRYLPRQDQLLVGFREKSSNHLSAIDHCHILDRKFGSIKQLKQLLLSLKGKAHIGHIELAMGDQDVALVIRQTAALNKEDIATLQHFARQQQWQLYVQPEQRDSIQRIDQDAPMRLHYTLNDFNIKFAFHPLDFTQVNSGVNAQMVKLACDLLQLQPGERVLDLFCGLGNFSLPLARCVGEQGLVVAVEGVDEMVHRGTENAKLNGLNQVKFYSQDLTKDFSHHSWAKLGFDALLIDPPRSGAEEVMHYLPKFGAKRIVYVSCNPATLARDTGLLVKQGYELKKVGVMDMFTHTAHVESIALFEQVRGL
ncbi:MULTISPECIES: 23S rRNA (uracil(1939)-C(5))-methyltransferase RlmD [unclassified Acinetobacter]|uniref:23S rRNA (uracil(1939)-C(5))-methyltransferase RlmD n=1 Tax=unclassified Acinetobacter TaxID=196816 RepID=UPI002934DCD7|nr:MULTISPECIES: 23S rRNA (uracil(1939)-C(5))-methyltransferase RlmD [unclassified Acinetobacter]WOE31245.1 23S rRNA (uracil(1939)-C(5))-methyltransferase RlmD [Acinetobacter sp. SAAs470]WOE39441.1 23S rRNA (uracil(1939)-C(5))-methyltransferase RlmD [Acinetobacter sp. SAAs474]